MKCFSTSAGAITIFILKYLAIILTKMFSKLQLSFGTIHF